MVAPMLNPLSFRAELALFLPLAGEVVFVILLAPQCVADQAVCYSPPLAIEVQPAISNRPIAGKRIAIFSRKPPAVFPVSGQPADAHTDSGLK